MYSLRLTRSRARAVFWNAGTGTVRVLQLKGTERGYNVLEGYPQGTLGSHPGPAGPGTDTGGRGQARRFIVLRDAATIHSHVMSFIHAAAFWCSCYAYEYQRIISFSHSPETCLSISCYIEYGMTWHAKLHRLKCRPPMDKHSQNFA